jgi:putative oligomerization/nucleic acid binding protein
MRAALVALTWDESVRRTDGDAEFEEGLMFGQDRRQRRRRLAAIGGAGIAAKRHHDAKLAEQEQAPEHDAPAEPAAPAAAAGGLSEESISRLKELGELHDQNVLSDEEFEQEKAKVLGSS